MARKTSGSCMKAFKFTLLSGTAVCPVLLIPCVWLALAYMRLFTSVPEVIDVGVRFLRATTVAVPILALQLTLMSIFQATGDAVKATIVSLGRQCLFYIPLLLLLNRIFGLDGLLFAQPAADLLTTSTALMSFLYSSIFIYIYIVYYVNHLGCI